MLVHDRNPESMRTVPRVCAAGRDSVPADAADARREFFFAFFSKNRPRREKWLEIKCFGYLETIFLAPQSFLIFGIFNLPQHSLMLRSGHLRNPGFPFFIGRRDPSSALCNPPPGSRHPISGVRDCCLRIPDSAIYIYLLPINRPCGRYVIIQS